jgi:hypothetical protein
MPGIKAAAPLTPPNIDGARVAREWNQEKSRRTRHPESEKEDVMARYVGGMKVGGGYFWNPRTWEVHVVGAEGGVLPGSERAGFVRIPFPLLFVVVPVLGALFLVFLPVIGFALIGSAIVRRVVGGVKAGAEDLAANVTPGWAPGAAHLAGKPGEEKKEGETKGSPAIEKLEKEIEEMRK